MILLWKKSLFVFWPSPENVTEPYCQKCAKNSISAKFDIFCTWLESKPVKLPRRSLSRNFLLVNWANVAFALFSQIFKGNDVFSSILAQFKLPIYHFNENFRASTTMSSDLQYKFALVHIGVSKFSKENIFSWFLYHFTLVQCSPSLSFCTILANLFK